MASSQPSADLAVLAEAAGAMEFPVFVKAVAGEGTRHAPRRHPRGAAGGTGETLPGMGLYQDAIVVRGAALQCRITAYRSPGGAGVRLDGGTALGAEIEAHYDSLLVKLTGSAVAARHPGRLRSRRPRPRGVH